MSIDSVSMNAYSVRLVRLGEGPKRIELAEGPVRLGVKIRCQRRMVKAGHEIIAGR